MQKIRIQKVRAQKFACNLVLLVIALAVSASAQLTTLASFDSSNGYIPIGPIARDSAGNIYGSTAYGGGEDNPGRVFKIASDGTITDLYTFCSLPGCADGDQPLSGVILATDGNIYGTTFETVYKLTTSGTLTTLHTFCSLTLCEDGDYAYGHLVQGSDGNFYGTTAYGGATQHEACEGGCGTVYKITPAGVLTTLHTFTGKDGYIPETGLVEGSDGSFYGTTNYLGLYGYGTIFKVSATGAFTLLHSFSLADGTGGNINLEGTDGNYYGTAFFNGPQDRGTAFKITPSGHFTLIRSFSKATGENPENLILGPKGNFLGSAAGGGANNGGTIFEMTPTGDMTILYQFCSLSNCADGSDPSAIMQTANGTLYGATSLGGENGCNEAGTPASCGTVFSFKP
jgi:uncharacterized repeat protein (TIGR03803 family)